MVLDAHPMHNVGTESQVYSTIVPFWINFCFHFLHLLCSARRLAPGILDNFMDMGMNYLRQCESAAHAQNVIRKALQQRGTQKVSLSGIQCDYDGNYGVYFVENRMYVTLCSASVVLTFNSFVGFLFLLLDRSHKCRVYVAWWITDLTIFGECKRNSIGFNELLWAIVGCVVTHIVLLHIRFLFPQFHRLRTWYENLWTERFKFSVSM